MSTPVSERTRRRPAVSVSRAGTAVAPARTAPARTIPAPRGTVTVPEQRGSRATRAAYAKRDERVRRLGGPRRPRVREASESAGRARFVLLVMGLLGVALVLTLWLSTAAAAGSYALQDARTATRNLTEQSERLHREVAGMQSAPALADRAAALGMVPVQDPARIVVGPDGQVTVVGKPAAAHAPAPPPAAPVAAPPAAPADPAAGAEGADGTVPGGPPAADPAAQTPPAADPAAVQNQPAAAAAGTPNTAPTGGGGT